MAINAEISHLPWTGSPVKVIRNLSQYFRDGLLGNDCRYLPKSITLFFDPKLDDQDIQEFIDKIALELKNELRARFQRLKQFEILQLLERDQIESFLTHHTNSQPWAIYMGVDGGLRIPDSHPRDHQAKRGVIPCSTMRNHGVAWQRSASGIQVWLVTSRKEGQDWDWDSDIGHESGHAAFAPVPIFVQSANLLKGVLHVDGLNSKRDLTPQHIARITYAYSELAVVTIRGEGRSTKTGTPLGQPDELFALLRLSHDLMPHVGFDQAMSVYERNGGYIDVMNGTIIYEIVAPMLRVIPYLKRVIKSFTPPTVNEFSHIVEDIEFIA